MKKLVGFVLYILTLTVLLGSPSYSTAYGQEPSQCKVQDKMLRAVEYQIAGFERSILSPDEPILLLKISVKPEQINSDYLISVGQNLNLRFCKEERLVVAIFDDYDIALHFRSAFEDALNALRGEYVLDRKTGEQYVSFSTVRDYKRSYDTTKKIDLNSITAARVGCH